MGWLSQLFESQPKASPGLEPQMHMAGEGEFDFDIVGESHYQDALEHIAGPKADESAEHVCIAVLVHENDNPYDANAIAAFIDGHKVGYLGRAHAEFWRKTMTKVGRSGQSVSVDALIVGGWYRGSDDEGSYGVKLDI